MMREGYEDLFSEHEPDELLRELNGNVLWHYLPMNPNDERQPVSSMAPFHAADEIERLREALREVMDLSHRRTTHPMSDEADYYRIARAALGEDK